MRFSKEEIEQLLKLFPDPIQRKNRVQELMLARWNAGFKRGTLEGATGIGKSRVGVLAALEAYEKNPDANVVVGTPTTSLRDDEWPEEFKKWGGSHIVDKVKFICHTAMADLKINGDIDLFIYDEIHHSTPANNVLFDKYKVWSVLGLSATLPTLKQDFERRTRIDKLSPTFFTITLEDAVALKLITEFEVIVLKFKLNDVDLNIPGGTQKLPTVTTEAAHYAYLTQRLASIMRTKKGSKFFYIQKRVDLIMNLPTKKQLAKEVMEQIIKDDVRTLVFCGSIDQCNELCGANVYHSKSTNHALNDFKAGKINYMGSVKALNEGKNIPNVDQSFIVQISAKTKDIVQRIGRNVRWRIGHVAKIIVLVAEDTMDEKWYEEAFYTFDKRRIKTYNITVKDKNYAKPKE